MVLIVKHCLFLATLPPFSTDGHRTCNWDSFTPTPIGFTTYLEHVQAKVEGDVQVTQTGCDLQHSMLSVAGTRTVQCGDGVQFKHAVQDLYNGHTHEVLTLTTAEVKATLHVHADAILPDDAEAPDTRPLTSLVTRLADVQLTVSGATVRRLATLGKSDWNPPPAPVVDTSHDDDAASSTSRKGRGGSAIGNRPKSSSKSRKDKDSKSKPSADDGAEIQASPSSIPPVFEPVDKTQLFEVQAVLGDSTCVGFQANGHVSLAHVTEPLVQPCQAHLKAPAAQELCRTITPNGCLIRVLKSGLREVFKPTGERMRFKPDGRCETLDFSDTCRQLDADNNLVADVGVSCVGLTSHPEKQQVFVHQDGSVLVDDASKDHAVEFADGTRIITTGTDFEQPKYRIECLGFPAVCVAQGIVTVHSGSVVLEHDSKKGLLSAHTTDGPKLKLACDGLATLEYRHASFKVHYIDAVLEGTDAARITHHFSRTGEYTMNQATTRLPLPYPLRFQPQLLVLRPDGTATRYLDDASVTDYSKAMEASPEVQVVTRRLATDVGTSSVTFVWDHREQNPHRQAYSTASILPPSLEHKITPHDLWQRPATHVAMR